MDLRLCSLGAAMREERLPVDYVPTKGSVLIFALVESLARVGIRLASKGSGARTALTFLPSVYLQIAKREPTSGLQPLTPAHYE
jgi:hypothetical protein